MIETDRPGCFFCFDGMDGTGKSTQMELFAQWLASQQIPYLACRDPGTTPLGETLRELLLNRHDLPIDMTSEMLLYMAARAQLVAQTVRPALQAGQTVVTDRFLLANVVYQGYAGGLDPEQLWQVGHVATGGLMPDCTFVLDLEAPVARSRLTGPPDRLESRNLEYWQRVRHGYLTEAARRSDIVVLDASRDVATIQAEIRSIAARFREQRQLTGSPSSLTAQT